MMILSSKDLLSFESDVVMVDGSFDPIHDGHIEYFRLASQFGFPVLCNIAPDDWTKKKHSVLLPVNNRAIVLDSIRYISFVTISTVSEYLDSVLNSSSKLLENFSNEDR